MNSVQAGSRLPRSLASAGLDDIIQPSFWSTSNFSLKMNQRAARYRGERSRRWGRCFTCTATQAWRRRPRGPLPAAVVCVRVAPGGGCAAGCGAATSLLKQSFEWKACVFIICLASLIVPHRLFHIYSSFLAPNESDLTVKPLLRNNSYLFFHE